MAGRRIWTKEDESFLESSWGIKSQQSIAKHLGRSLSAVKVKAGKMNLGKFTLSMDGITVNQLGKAIGYGYKTVVGWVDNHGLPARPRLVAEQKRVLFVKYEDFWAWAYEKKSMINFAKVPENALGPEPNWVKEKRRLDLLNPAKKRAQPWTPEEDQMLKNMIEAYRYTYSEFANTFKRSEAAIKTRLSILGIKGRPLRADNRTKWTDEQVRVLEEMFAKGWDPASIGKHLDRSEHSVRGKLERMNGCTTWYRVSG